MHYKEDIDEKYDAVATRIAENGHLDHVINAAAAIVQEELRAIRKLDTITVHFEKKAYPMCTSKGKVIGGKGYAYLHKGSDRRCGGTIFYREDLTPREKRAVIAHETGHLLLHGELESREPLQTAKYRNHDKMEQEACYFADIALTKRSEQYASPLYHRDNCCTAEEIEDMIQGVYKEYDPKSLPCRPAE